MTNIKSAETYVALDETPAATLEKDVVESFKDAANDLKRIDTLARAFYEGARLSESSIFWNWPSKWRDLNVEHRATFRAGVIELLAELKFEADIFHSL